MFETSVIRVHSHPASRYRVLTLASPCIVAHCGVLTAKLTDAVADRSAKQMSFPDPSSRSLASPRRTAGAARARAAAPAPQRRRLNAPEQSGRRKLSVRARRASRRRRPRSATPHRPLERERCAARLSDGVPDGNGSVRRSLHGRWTSLHVAAPSSADHHTRVPPNSAGCSPHPMNVWVDSRMHHRQDGRSRPRVVKSSLARRQPRSTRFSIGSSHRAR